MQKFAAKAGLTFHLFSGEYLSRLAFAAACLVSGAYVNCLASVVAGYRTPWIVVRDLDGKLTDRVTLPDLGHDVTGWVTDAMGLHRNFVDHWLELHGVHLMDCLVCLGVFSAVVFVVAHPKRLQILRRVLMIASFTFLLRALCVFATQLPDASPKCQAQFVSEQGAYKRHAMFPKAFFRAWTLLWHPTDHVTCGDMVFSAHTSLVTQSAMTFFKYCRLEEMGDWPVLLWPIELLAGRRVLGETFCLMVRLGAILYAGVVALLVIATKLHYTLDVGLAVYLNVQAFLWYHNTAKYEWLKKRKPFYHVLFGYGQLMQWLEAEEVIATETASFESARAAALGPRPSTGKSR